MVDNKELITIAEGGSEKRFVAKKGDSVNDTFNHLTKWISEIEIPLEIIRNTHH